MRVQSGLCHVGVSNRGDPANPSPFCAICRGTTWTPLPPFSFSGVCHFGQHPLLVETHLTFGPLLFLPSQGALLRDPREEPFQTELQTIGFRNVLLPHSQNLDPRVDGHTRCRPLVSFPTCCLFWRNYQKSIFGEPLRRRDSHI